MAGSILIIRTPPGRLPRGRQLRLATYEVIFLYRLLPPILDNDGVKVTPTPLADLVSLVGQPWIDRYLDGQEVAGLDSGDAAWEYVAGERRVVREPDQSLRLETIPELIARLETQHAVMKTRALADWTAEYEFAGRRIVP